MLEKSSIAEKKELLMAEEIWLRYFNRYLYEHKTISLREFTRMEELISIHIGTKRKIA